MFLEKGWKTFIRSCNFKKRDSIVFRYDGDETLWAKCFDSDGDRVECCMESSSSSDSEFYKVVMKPTIYRLKMMMTPVVMKFETIKLWSS